MAVKALNFVTRYFQSLAILGTRLRFVIRGMAKLEYHVMRVQ